MRPPRLGGNKKLGVLATRSTFRPNPIGMSVVKLDRIEHQLTAHKESQVVLHISELDLLDGTPIVDIKPYVPYADIIEDSHGGYAHQQPSNDIHIIFTDASAAVIEENLTSYPTLRLLIEQVLSQDPRPAYKQKSTDDKIYGMTLHEFNIQWQFDGGDIIKVLSVEVSKG